ncbi:hypothetical protein FACS1894155_02310 [Bacteroidia bacterium]|nr:hypothetical protein FACS1894155_02310 [Bacteroidia bacterium]
MKKGNRHNITPIVVTYKSSIDFYKEITKKIGNAAQNLPNKFLFLGQQGANLWEKIDKTYKAGAKGEVLIEENFAQINELIKEGSPYKPYDIISLGVGRGMDDIKILKQIQIVNKGKIKKFNIYAVDLSSILLKCGILQISDWCNGVEATQELKQNIKSIRGIWADFEELPTLKSKLKNDIQLGNNKSLYHLLGLTLGNNDESVLLKSIYGLMEVEDFLLLGIDFCVSHGEIAISDAEKEYTTGEAAASINQFMLGPLHFISTHKKTNNDFYKIANTLDEIKILHGRAKHISKIDKSVSFTRTHIFKKEGSRLCDYSTKYEEDSFKRYITETLKLENVFFEWKECFKAEDVSKNTQALVLLQKKGIKKKHEVKEATHAFDYANEISLLKVEIETVEEAKQQLLNKIIEKLSSQNIDVNLYKKTFYYSKNNKRKKCLIIEITELNKLI